MELVCRDHLKSIFKFTYHEVYSLWYVIFMGFNKSLGLCDPLHHCDTRQLCYPGKLHCDALSSLSLLPPLASIHLFPLLVILSFPNYHGAGVMQYHVHLLCLASCTKHDAFEVHQSYSSCQLLILKLLLLEVVLQIISLFEQLSMS